MSFWRRKKQNKVAVVQNLDSLLEESGQYTRLSDTAEIRIAVDKIADLVSNMTIQLLENTDKGDKKVKDELARKVDIYPCEHMTRKQWVFKIVRDLLLYGDGNALVHIELNSAGYIENLRPLNAHNVTFESHTKGYQVEYLGTKYHSDELIHFVLNPRHDEYWRGSGYKTTLRELANNLNQATKTKSSFMKGKYMPSLVVKVDAMNEEMSSEEGRNNIIDQYLSNDSQGKPWVIPAELLEVQQVKPLSLKDIAINESVELDKKTVARILDVPPFFLGVGDFNKQEFNNFINTRIYSIGQIISQTLTRDLLISPTRYFKLNPRSLYSYDISELVGAGTQLVDRNAMYRNELRNWVGLEPSDEMEQLLVLENYLPVAELGNQKKLKGGEVNE